MLKIHYVALAASPEAAITAVKARRGTQCNVEVVAEGDEPMTMARRLRLPDGEVSEL